MRLLDTNTLQLQEFVDHVPPYAILSHTWAKEEVVFDDLKHGLRKTIRPKSGLQKLKRFCAIAAEHGYKYAWMDTCCIDKSSSAELSESINSMFRWYWNSDVCFVYLKDFVRGPSGADFSVEAAKHCRYFTRGWTLQELISPQKVTFYDSNWDRIGHLSSREILEVVSDITRVPREVLENRDRIWNTCVAQRLSWASQRKTLREEDVAYSLLGLLDVNMPLLYGEGGRKAFHRLQQEFLRGSMDQSIFAWTDLPFTTFRASGFLADSPQYFQGAGDIFLVSSGAATEPYGLTNMGLQMVVTAGDQNFSGTSPADRIRPDILVVPLNCARSNTRHKNNNTSMCTMCMVLERAHYAKNIYKRLDTVQLSIDQFFLPRGERRTIHVLDDTQRSNAFQVLDPSSRESRIVGAVQNIDAQHEDLYYIWDDTESSFQNLQTHKLHRFTSQRDQQQH